MPSEPSSMIPVYQHSKLLDCVPKMPKSTADAQSALRRHGEKSTSSSSCFLTCTELTEECRELGSNPHADTKHTRGRGRDGALEIYT